ncbi:MAG: putative ABC transporter permease [Eubacteriales bacterium]|nr:putative ABC transporter permease [Eubacteriales bacterium]
MLLGYTWIQWLFFFFFYSFFGWCFESTYVTLKSKKPVNRGFIRGPFLPLYGSGALMMLIVSAPFSSSLILTYIAGCIGATALEYVTGVTMEALFKVRYWDYSQNKFNFQGQICLGSSLAWGFLTILMTRVVHRPIERFAFWLPEGILTLVTMLIAVYFVVDFTLSFRAALDLRDLLIKMEQAKLELERMQKRLDVIIALNDEAMENRKKEREEERAERLEEFVLRWDELVENIEGKFGRIREALPASELLLEKRDELLELRSKFRTDVEKREAGQFVSDFIKRSMIKGNPTMVSGRFAEALEELKRSATEYRKKKKNEE